jgi:hypothetical protein
MLRQHARSARVQRGEVRLPTTAVANE